jgi:hypothetical protein
MTMTQHKTIAFADHGRFHRTALHMAAAGGLMGLAGHVATLLEPRLGTIAAPPQWSGVTESVAAAFGGTPVGPLPLAAVAGAAIYGAAPPETRARARDLAAVVIGAAIAAGALAAVARGDMAAAWGGAIFAGALGLLLARGLGGRRFWIAAAGGAAAVLAGRFVMTSLAGAAFGPAWLVAGASGAAFGLVALLGTLPRHLSLADSTRERGEAAEILARARAAQAEPRVRALLDQLAALDRDNAQAPSRDVLEARLTDLERRAQATSDPIARREYEQAREAVAEQLREVEGIGHGRERVLARLHHELAEVERARLSASSAEADVVSRAIVETDDGPTDSGA